MTIGVARTSTMFPVTINYSLSSHKVHTCFTFPIKVLFQKRDMITGMPIDLMPWHHKMNYSRYLLPSATGSSISRKQQRGRKNICNLVGLFHNAPLVSNTGATRLTFPYHIHECSCCTILSSLIQVCRLSHYNRPHLKQWWVHLSKKRWTWWQHGVLPTICCWANKTPCRESISRKASHPPWI